MRSQFDDKEPPAIGDVLARVGALVRQSMSRFGSIVVIVGVLAVILTGTYKVGPGEQGVVRTMGRETAKTPPGLRFRIPLIQQVDIVNVEQIRRIEVGARGEQRVPTEALMITGDANIVEAHMIIQYRIVDASKFLFELKDPDETMRATAEVALRSVVGRTSIDEVITTGREKVQQQTMEWLQLLMDKYQSGVRVTEVKLQAVDAPDEVRDAFHEVVRAREEKEKLINQAMGYQADQIPRARGEAQKMLRESEGYREQRVLEARGNVAKFESVLTEYQKAEKVTRERLYLETMERIVGRAPHKVIVDEKLSKGVIPWLPLGDASRVSAAQGGNK